jgi:hypothetical protein
MEEAEGILDASDVAGHVDAHREFKKMAARRTFGETTQVYYGNQEQIVQN